jgi:hypothetical protein
MTAKQPNGTGLDELLKRVLADDLPPDVAAGMRVRLDRFRARTTEKEKRMPILAPFFWRSAWAALSILMLVSGSLLQGLGSRNPLSDRISLIRTSLAVAEHLAVAESMSCSARVRKEDGEFLDCEIEWRSGGPAEVLVKGPDGSLLRSFKLGEPRDTADPLVRAVASFSTPSAVGEHLSGGWRFVKFSREAKCDIGTYTIPAGTGPEALEFTIDMCTYLPVRITGTGGLSSSPGGPGDIFWEARFRF